MKKGVFLKILHASIVFASVFTCFFGYLISSNTVYAVNNLDYLNGFNVQKEEVILDNITENRETIVPTNTTYNSYSQKG